MLPTVLLVHGAFDETAAWSGVIASLGRRTIDAVAVANPLSGLRRDAAYVASLAAAVDGAVVLTGQGYGGAVVTVAAEACANAAALVYVAAFAPDVGESCLDLVRGSHDPRPLEALHPAVVRRDDGPAAVEMSIRRDRFREVFAGDLPAEEAALLAAQQRAVLADALEEPATVAAWRWLPSWYVVSADDRLLPPDVQRRMAERAGSEVVELRAAHAVTRTREAEVAEVIARAAEHVAG